MSNDESASETLRPSRQSQYGGGQVCPVCDESLGVADYYCRWCGTQLRGDDS